VFGGVALFHFDPYAYDTTGRKVFLRGLSTEGEGLAAYPGRKEYSLWQVSIPFGGGIKFRISDRVVLAYEIGDEEDCLRIYLDDVSKELCQSGRTDWQLKGSEAVEMAYRGNELKDGPAYPAAGTPIRGPHQPKTGIICPDLRVTIALKRSAQRSLSTAQWRDRLPGKSILATVAARN
jgi:hypothetical protein